MQLSDKHAEALVTAMRERGDGLSLSVALKIEELSRLAGDQMAISAAWGTENARLRGEVRKLTEALERLENAAIEAWK